jgi:GPH family glycoside/pentoside/hexuronide:cation symporter
MNNGYKLSFPVKLAYWFGQLAEGLKNSAFSILLLFYFNQVLGVSASLCGLALFIATAIDAVTDPMMGTISDNWRSKTLGRRHPFMFASAAPLAICLYLLFVPMVEGEWSLFVWLTVFAVLTRISMTFYHVPHLALGAELTRDFDERTSIVAFRMVFGVMGWMIVAIGFGVFFAATDEYPNGQLDPTNYPPFLLLLSIGIFISIIVTSWGTMPIIPHLPQPKTDKSQPLTQVFEDLLLAFQNRSFRWLVISFMATSVPVGIGGAFGLYVTTFYWELTPSQVPMVLMAGFVSTLLGYVLAPTIGRRFDKRPVLIWGVGIWALATLMPFLLRFTGIFPVPGSLSSLVVLVIFALIAGIGISQLVVAISSMMADIADEHDLNSGRRNEGVFFGAFAFCNKAAVGLGAGVGGVLLDFISWPTGENIKTAADIPPEVLTNLALLAGPLVASAFVPFYFCIQHYDIDRERHGEIRLALAARDSPV